jgi:hypothetical protein
LAGEPDLIAKVSTNAVVVVSPATGRRGRKLAPSQAGWGIFPLFVVPGGTVIGTVGEGIGTWGVGLVPPSGAPRIEVVPGVPCSTQPALALSPDGRRFLWLVGTCSAPPSRAAVLYEYDLSGKQLAVSSPSGAISPKSWGGPGGGYVAGYLPPPSETPVDIFLGPVGVAPVHADGKVGRPRQISGGGPGCRLTYPGFVPGSDKLLAVDDCRVRVVDSVAWGT